MKYIIDFDIKYVHITDSTLISRIKSNGIRKGGGRRGKGVYFIPLLFLNLRSYDGIESELVSNINSWKFWIRTKSNGTKKPVAIIFESSDEMWPIDSYIDISHEIALKLFTALKTKNPDGLRYAWISLVGLGGSVSQDFPLLLYAGNYPCGIYILNIISNNNMVSKKVIVPN